MNRIHIPIIALAALFALAGCAKEIENTLDDRNSTAIELSSVSTDQVTKAVITGTSFTTDEAAAGIGLFLLDNEGKAYGANPANVKYTFSSDKWSAASPLRVGNSKGYLYGYYPYSNSVTDITAIPVASSVNGTDWLYATPVEVTTTNAKSVSLALDHALARVSLSFKLDGSYVGDGSLSEISLSGNSVAASGTLDATDGNITASASKFTAGTDLTLSKSAATTLECLVVPVTGSDTPEFKIACTIDGKAFAKTFTGDIAALASGKQTTIELTVLNIGIEVDATSINGWDENGSQKVIVGGNHTVTINLADTVGVHDILTDVYVDGNSTIIRASSCSGEHLKCIMGNGEFCSSQSRTGNLVYTFTISDITEDTSATIGYANAVSLSILPSNSAGSVEISGGDLYEGETVSLKATPNEYYIFVRWKNESGDIICEDEKCENVYLTSKDIRAEFWSYLILNGVFSVDGSGKKVRFTGGNLYRDEAGYKTERNQYDFNSNNYSSTVAHVSHFMWCSSSYNAACGMYDYSLDGQTTFFADASSLTVTGIGKSGRALTKDEWSYLFGDNAARRGKYKTGVKICNKKNCVVLMPDNWDGDADDIKDSYNALEWRSLEIAGAVCLPAAGYRKADPDYINYAYVQDSDRNGNYWSATTSGDTDANCLSFNGSSINPTGVAGRYWAYAVRLVVDVTE